MKARGWWSAAALSLAACAAPAWSLGLGQAWQAALAHDPQFRAASHERDAAREGVGVARAATLPAVNLQVSRTQVNGDREFANSLNQTVRTQVDYEAPQTVVQLRAPLFNEEARARVGVAQSQADAADAQYRSRRNELADRLGSAYLSALLAQENLRLAGTQAEQARVQVGRAERRLAQGEGTRVELVQAQAALTLGLARERESADRVAVALRDLQRMTGLPLAGLQVTMDGLLLAPLDPSSLSTWVERALRDNAALESKRQQVQAAGFNVRRNRAGHLPRLDGVVTLSQASNESLSTLNQKSQTHSVGVQLVVPLFSGFGVQAGVRQAEADQMRAQEEVRALAEALELEVQRQFLAVQSGVSRIDAQKAVVAAQQVALRATQRAVEEGVGTLATVLEAQAQYYTAQRDLAQARQEYLLARLRLMAQAGLGADEVVADIDRQLVVAAPGPNPPMPGSTPSADAQPSARSNPTPERAKP